MSDKIKKVYEALIEGAEAGLTNEALFAHVVANVKKASSKRIVKAALLALSDPDVKDAKVLEAIYALAIRHRLDPVSADDIDDVAEEPSDPVIMPAKKKSKKAKMEAQPETPPAAPAPEADVAAATADLDGSAG